jgi:hypothetical protein
MGMFEVRSRPGQGVYPTVREMLLGLYRSGHRGQLQWYTNRPDPDGSGTIETFCVHFARLEH